MAGLVVGYCMCCGKVEQRGFHGMDALMDMTIDGITVSLEVTLCRDCLGVYQTGGTNDVRRYLQLRYAGPVRRFVERLDR